MTKTYYKVIRRACDDTYRSCTIISSVSVEYIPGTFVKADIGGLFIFNDLEAARYFKHLQLFGHRMGIWECEAINPRKIKLIISPDFVRPFDDHLLDFWKLRSKMRHKSLLCLAPGGSMIADAVKLTKYIEGDCNG